MKKNVFTFAVVTILFCIGGITLAQCPSCPSGYVSKTFDWEPGAYSKEAIISSTTPLNYAIGSNNMGLTISGDYGNSTPVDDNTIITRGGYGNAGNESLRISTTSGSTTNTLTFTFRVQVQCLRFSVYDVDESDNISFSGSPTLTAVSATPDFSISASTATGNGANNNDNRGSLNVEYAGLLTSFTITVNASAELAFTNMTMCTPESGIPSSFCTDNPLTFDWTSHSYSAGTSTQTFTVNNPSGDDVEVTFTWSGDTGHVNTVNDGNPGYYKSQGGLVAVDDGLELVVDPPAASTTSSLILTVSFSKSVKDLRFSLYDIDQAATSGTGAGINDRVDKVTLSGSPKLEADSKGASFGLISTTVAQGVLLPYLGLGNQGTGGTAGIFEPNATPGRGTLNVYYPGRTSSFSLTYEESSGGSDPSLRAIELSDMLFCMPTVLPVELTHFTATANGTNADLAWQTASEENNSHFEVERSADGLSWSYIGQVAGAGNSSTTLHYTYTDDLTGGLSYDRLYYRLKQVDFDGTFDYSTIRAVNPPGGMLVLYPNPAKRNASLTIRFDNPIWDVMVSDILGTVLLHKRYDDNPAKYVDLDISELQTGVMYFIRANGETSGASGKFVVN